MSALSIEQSIIHTLAFFSLFDAPLTREEVYRFLWQNVDMPKDDVLHVLSTLEELGVIVYDRGYLSLNGKHTSTRIKRIRLIEQKMKIAKRAAAWLRYVPFIRAVFVCNNLALETVTPESDIDVFIIVKPGRIWTARVIATTLLRIAKLARTRKKIIDRICLSFYVTEDELDFSSITIVDPDVYMMYWIRSLMPLYDPDNLYEVMQRENSWVDAYVRPLYDVSASAAWRVGQTMWSRRVQRVFETMWSGEYGDVIEREAKKLQLAKMKLRDSVRDEPDSRVIVSDTMLKFHENDRRVHYQEEWLARVDASLSSLRKQRS